MKDFSDLFCKEKSACLAHSIIASFGHLLRREKPWLHEGIFFIYKLLQTHLVYIICAIFGGEDVICVLIFILLALPWVMKHTSLLVRACPCWCWRVTTDLYTFLKPALLYVLLALPLLNNRDTNSHSDFLLVLPGGRRFGVYRGWEVSSKEESGCHLPVTAVLQIFIYFSTFIYI